MNNSITINVPTCNLHGVDASQLQECVEQKAAAAQITITVHFSHEVVDYTQVFSVSDMSIFNDQDGSITQMLRRFAEECFNQLKVK